MAFEKIILKSESIKNQVMFKLDKDNDLFTYEEIKEIKELVIDYLDEEESGFVFLEDLSKFKGLKDLTLRNGYIYNDNFNIFLKLKSIEKITFDACSFENADLIASLPAKGLFLINADINSYNFIYIMKQLRGLSIINGNIDIERLNQLTNLVFLCLSYSKIIKMEDIKLNNLEELYIDNTNISDFAFVKVLKKLKRISVDEEQYQKNINIFKDLKEKHVLVLNENMVEFGDNYEV